MEKDKKFNIKIVNEKGKEQDMKYYKVKKAYNKICDDISRLIDQGDEDHIYRIAKDEPIVIKEAIIRLINKDKEEINNYIYAVNRKKERNNIERLTKYRQRNRKLNRILENIKKY